MYRTSADRRFQKNQALIRRAFLDLAKEKDFQKITVADITRRANINRMTFYSHYDTVDDIFTEFVDGMEQALRSGLSQDPDMSLDRFYHLMNELMFREEEFFRATANSDRGSMLRNRFRHVIKELFRTAYEAKTTLSTEQQTIRADLNSAMIAYAYFDWLLGKMGSASLDTVLGELKTMLRSQGDFS